MLQIDNETLKESGSIIHTLLLRHAREGIETPPGDSSVYWSHFSEGSLMLYLVASRNSAFLHQILTESAQTDEERSGMKRHHDAMVAWAKSNVQPALEETDMFIDQKGNFTGDKDLIGEGDVSSSRHRELLGWLGDDHTGTVWDPRLRFLSWSLASREPRWTTFDRASRPDPPHT